MKITKTNSKSNAALKKHFLSHTPISVEFNRPTLQEKQDPKKRKIDFLESEKDSNVFTRSDLKFENCSFENCFNNCIFN